MEQMPVVEGRSMDLSSQQAIGIPDLDSEIAGPRQDSGVR